MRRAIAGSPGDVVTTTANQMSEIQPNTLRSMPRPNALTGMVGPGMAESARPGRPYIAVAGVGLAVLALVLVLWRG